MPTSARRPNAVRWRRRTRGTGPRAAEGATVATGGRRVPGLDRGFFSEPTLLIGVTNDMTIAQEEVFGPVTSVITYSDEADAIRIANDTRFGLDDSIYSPDTKHAAQLARQVRAGTVAINTAGVSITEPFGGVKCSGWGRVCGSADGIRQFTEVKQVLMDNSKNG